MSEQLEYPSHIYKTQSDRKKSIDQKAKVEAAKVKAAKASETEESGK